MAENRHAALTRSLLAHWGAMISDMYLSANQYCCVRSQGTNTPGNYAIFAHSVIFAISTCMCLDFVFHWILKRQSLLLFVIQIWVISLFFLLTQFALIGYIFNKTLLVWKKSLHTKVMSHWLPHNVCFFACSCANSRSLDMLRRWSLTCLSLDVFSGFRNTKQLWGLIIETWQEDLSF